MDELIMTGVAHVAAAHLVETRRSTGTRDELTAVWSTRPVRCSTRAPGHLCVSWAADSIPRVFDTTGCGDWSLWTSAQCGCGEMISAPSRLHHGHLRGAALTAAAQSVAAAAEVTTAADRQQLLDELRGWLTDACAQLRAAGIDPRAATSQDLDAHLWGLPRGSVSDPGVWCPEEEEAPIEAWGYDPDGEVVVVRVTDLDRSFR